ncbi:MAG: hypothetical protein PWQ09_923 [Candidatus Cloacimonadota bacterium]|jgi:hypothetical protein|nr:hypothetical protein [Candidatus Cloacimonadota bacterium]
MQDKKNESYLDNINPTIKKTLNHEQKQEIKSVLKRLLPPAYGKEVIDIRFTFWFLKKWYFVFIFGLDQRRDIEFMPDQRQNRALIIIFKAIIFLLIILGLLASAFGILYALKSISGIDLFPSSHFNIL